MKVHTKCDLNVDYWKKLSDSYGIKSGNECQNRQSDENI